MNATLLARLKDPHGFTLKGDSLPFHQELFRSANYVVTLGNQCCKDKNPRHAAQRVKALESVASPAIAHLESLPRCRPRQAAAKEFVQPLSALLYSAHAEYKIIQGGKKSETLQKCARVLNAYLLGITPDCFDESINPGFEKFVTRHYFDARSHLAQELVKYNHELQVAPDRKVSILMGGKLVPWIEAKDTALADPDGAISERYPEIWNPAWKYGQDGVQNKHAYEWTVAKPFKVVKNPPWKGRYIFEICCTCQGTFRAWGDHTWFRLKTPDGAVYSFGKYRVNSTFAHAWENQPSKRQSPDLSEYWRGIEEIHTLAFQITKQRFDAVIAKLENDQKEDDLTFNVSSQTNCTADTLDFARMCGINISADINFPYLLVAKRLPAEIEDTVWSIQNDLPAPVQAVTRNLAYPFFVIANCVQAVCGGTTVNERFSKADVKRLKVTPKFKSILDYLNPSKSITPCPYMLVHHVYPWVKKVRQMQEERESLKSGALKYSVPTRLKLKQLS